MSTEIIELKEKVKELQLVLLECEKITVECICEDGLCDSFDTDGDPYKSHHLNLLLEEARKNL